MNTTLVAVPVFALITMTWADNPTRYAVDARLVPAGWVTDIAPEWRSAVPISKSGLPAIRLRQSDQAAIWAGASDLVVTHPIATGTPGEYSGENVLPIAWDRDDNLITIQVDEGVVSCRRVDRIGNWFWLSNYLPMPLGTHIPTQMLSDGSFIGYTYTTQPNIYGWNVPQIGQYTYFEYNPNNWAYTTIGLVDAAHTGYNNSHSSRGVRASGDLVIGQSAAMLSHLTVGWSAWCYTPATGTRRIGLYGDGYFDDGTWEGFFESRPLVITNDGRVIGYSATFDAQPYYNRYWVYDPATDTTTPIPQWNAMLGSFVRGGMSKASAGTRLLANVNNGSNNSVSTPGSCFTIDLATRAVTPISLAGFEGASMKGSMVGPHGDALGTVQIPGMRNDAANTAGWVYDAATGNATAIWEPLDYALGRTIDPITRLPDGSWFGRVRLIIDEYSRRLLGYATWSHERGIEPFDQEHRITSSIRSESFDASYRYLGNAGDTLLFLAGSPSTGDERLLFVKPFRPCSDADLGSHTGDTTPDGILDNGDFVVFVYFFFNLDPRADVGTPGGLPGHDGRFSADDFIAFINAFFNGC